jgi:hypothetical protein
MFAGLNTSSRPHTSHGTPVSARTQKPKKPSEDDERLGPEEFAKLKLSRHTKSSMAATRPAAT